jgi:hypothetical protein
MVINFMTNLIIGCLIYLNDNVFDRRIDRCRQSFSSFHTFDSQKENISLLFINNGNDQRVNQELKNCISLKYDLINLGTNFLDISVHMCSYWKALQTGAPYFAYTYDDFVFYNDHWVKDAINFMNSYKNVSCMRLPKYEYNNAYYNANITSKSINPDAVRHEDGAGGVELQMIDSSLLGSEFSSNKFYLTNWRPNSRPTLWRTDYFTKIIEGYVKLPVMQMFEKLLYDYADKNKNDYISSFIDGGTCYTFLEQTSERTRSPNHYRDVLVNVKDLRKAFEDSI